MAASMAETQAEELECLVCQDKLLQDEVQQFLPCAHGFHLECLRNWEAAKGARWQDLPCPACRMVPSSVHANEFAHDALLDDRQDGDAVAPIVPVDDATDNDDDDEPIGAANALIPSAFNPLLALGFAAAVPANAQIPPANNPMRLAAAKAAPKAKATAAKSKAAPKAKAKAALVPPPQVDDVPVPPQQVAEVPAPKAKAKAKGKAKAAVVPPQQVEEVPVPVPQARAKAKPKAKANAEVHIAIRPEVGVPQAVAPEVVPQAVAQQAVAPVPQAVAPVPQAVAPVPQAVDQAGDWECRNCKRKFAADIEPAAGRGQCRCKQCNSKRTRLYRENEWSKVLALSDEDALDFFSCSEDMKTTDLVKKLSAYTCTNSESHDKEKIAQGEWQPLAVWETRGYDKTLIEQDCTSDERKWVPN